MNEYGIKTYADLAKTVGGMVLANEMEHRPLELVNGDIAPWDEIFQWHIISRPDFLVEHTDEPVFYDEELDVYVWRITHFDTDWDCMPAPRDSVKMTVPVREPPFFYFFNVVPPFCESPANPEKLRELSGTTKLCQTVVTCRKPPKRMPSPPCTRNLIPHRAKRDAGCAPTFSPECSQGRFTAQKNPKGTSTTSGLKRLKTQNTAS